MFLSDSPLTGTSLEWTHATRGLHDWLIAWSVCIIACCSTPGLRLASSPVPEPPSNGLMFTHPKDKAGRTRRRGLARFTTHTLLLGVEVMGGHPTPTSRARVGEVLTLHRGLFGWFMSTFFYFTTKVALL